MHRTVGRSLAYMLFQRNSSSQVASMAARTVSNKKPSDTKDAVEESQSIETPSKRSE